MTDIAKATEAIESAARTDTRFDLVFTGTQGYAGRPGMNRHQMTTVRRRLEAVHLDHPRLMVHHGGCVGADAQFHSMCLAQRVRIYVWPGHLPDRRAVLDLSPDLVRVMEPLHTIDRNERMVALGNLLLAAPAGMHEVRRSGTWTTMRRARDRPIPILVAWPNGTEGPWP